MSDSTKTQVENLLHQRRFLPKRALHKWIREIDLFLVFIVFIMWLFSLIFASKIILHTGEVDIDKHLFFLVLSLAIMSFCSFLTVSAILKISYIALPFLVILLVLTLSDTFGQEYNHAYRSFFIPILNIPIQPSALITPFFAVFVSKCLAEWRNDDSYLYGLVACVVTMLIATIVYIQPDVDTALLFILYAFAVLLFTGICPSKRVAIIALSVIILATITLVYLFSHAINRIFSFFSNINDDSHSAIIRKAVENGGLFGYNDSAPYPYMTIPQGHNDVILASIIQEFGLLGSFIPLLLIGTFFLYTVYSINKLRDLFNILSSVCLLLMLSIPTILHIAVTLGFAPILGQNLLLTSTGGSTLISNAISVGFLLVFLKDKINPLNLKPTIIS